jgi:hypothetical protein
MYTGVVGALGAILWMTACSSGDSSSSASNTPPHTQAPPSFTNGVLQAFIKSSNPRGGTRPTGEPRDLKRPGDEFGLSVAMSGDTLAVGAPNESSCATGINGDQTNSAHFPGEPCYLAGAVYVFTRANGTWAHQAYIKASNTETSDQFGWRVALSGDTLAVTALYEHSCARGINGDQTNNDCPNGGGAVYVFTRANGVWSQQAYLKAINTGVAVNGGFGYSLALDGETLAVGSYTDSSCATGINGDPFADCGIPTGAATSLCGPTASGLNRPTSNGRSAFQMADSVLDTVWPSVTTP